MVLHAIFVFCLNNILFHDFDVDFVVEVDDVFMLSMSDKHFQVDITCISLKSVDILVNIDDVVESNLHRRLDLTDPIYGAHDQLVKMSVYKELWLS